MKSTITEADRILQLINECADRALAQTDTKDAPYYFAALLGYALCNEGSELGRKLIDIVDMASLKVSLLSTTPASPNGGSS